MKLQKEWKKRLELYAEAHKLIIKGSKLIIKDSEPTVTGYPLTAEGYKIQAEGDKLIKKGIKLWAEAVLKAYGNIKMEWKNWNEKHKSSECHLENGEVYGFSC